MTQPKDTAGAAALAIVESLLLALEDRKILPRREITGILQDAARAHEDRPDTETGPGHHAAVVALIDGILAGRSSVPRP